MSDERQVSGSEMTEAAWKALPYKERVRLAVEIEAEELASHMASEPNWEVLGFLDIVSEGLNGLRHYLENEEAEEVTWEVPFVELQYPVDWQWGNPQPSPEAPGGQEQQGSLCIVWPEEDLASLESATAAVNDNIRQHRNVHILQTVTDRAAIQHKGEMSYPLLPVDVRQEIRELDADAQAARLTQLYVPYTIGRYPLATGPYFWETCAQILAFNMGQETLEDFRALLSKHGVDPSNWTDEVLRGYLAKDVLESEAGEALDAMAELVLNKLAVQEEDFPPFIFELERGGTPFAVSVVAAVYPLQVYSDEEKAYYPVGVGLLFDEDTEPTAWTDDERARFWADLQRAVAYRAEELRGFEPEDEADAGPGGPALDLPEGTVEAALQEPAEDADRRHGPTVVPVPAERRPAFSLSFGITRADARAMDFVDHVQRLHLPKRWSSIPRWEDLAAQEIRRLREEYGEDAFRRSGGRDAQLVRRTDRDGREVVRLATEAERTLKIAAGLRTGFLRVDERDSVEYLVRLVQAGTGYLEVGLSWFGFAGPLVDDWRAGLRKDADRAVLEAQQGVLFENLAEDRQRRLDTLLTRVRILDHGRRAMEMILGQLGRQAQNPVVVPAEAFRVLLGLQEDDDWKSKVDGCLLGLQHLRSALRSFDLDRDLYGYGTFLAGYTHVGRGRGAHGDGDYYLEVGQQFVGCLQVFERGRRKLRGKVEAVTFDWSREIPSAERATLGWTRKSRAEGVEADRFHVFDSGRVFYNAAEGLTPEQEQLVAFLEAQLTRRRDTAAKDPTTGRPWCRKARPDADDAHEPRTYTRTFCPLLPEDQCFHGALSHFAKNAEAGRTLGGAARREGRTGGAHTAGLLHEMGYLLEPGGATEARRRTVEKALEDLRAVVVDYLGGIVAARGPDGSWLTAAEAQAFPWDALVYRTRWFLFMPEDWREARRRRWEERTGYRATEDEAAARRVRESRWSGEDALPSPVGGRVGLEGSPLRLRLHVAMKERGLSQGAVAQLFGVSQPVVSLWFKGTEPDPDTGEVKGKPIPAELVPLVERWVSTGEPPTEEELEARRTRRKGRRQGEL